MADRSESATIVSGLTLRDHFALSILQGIIASGTPMKNGIGMFKDIEDVIGHAYEYADCMLRMRNR